MMRWLRYTVLPLMFAGGVSAIAETQADIDAVNAVIDRYGVAEAAMDMEAQAALMAPDRLWVSQHFHGRRTDNARNMEIQKAWLDSMRAAAPGVQQYVEDLERLIRFYADDRVAVASFYRHTTRLYAADTKADVRERYGEGGGPEAITLVLEKRNGDWIIVATHVSALE